MLVGVCDCDLLWWYGLIVCRFTMGAWFAALRLLDVVVLFWYFVLVGFDCGVTVDYSVDGGVFCIW